MCHHFKQYQLEVIAELQCVGWVGIGASGGSGSLHGSMDVMHSGVGNNSHLSLAAGNDSSDKSNSD